MHVDNVKGLDDDTCGRPAHPCKTLMKGIKQIRKHGRVYIIGDQYLSETIEMTNSLIISGVGNTTVNIFNNGTLQNAFTWNSHGQKYASLSFTALIFNNIGIVDVTPCALINVTIDKCTVYGRVSNSTSNVVRVTSVYKKARVFLYISNSKFTETGKVIEMKGELKSFVRINKSVFRGTKGITIEGTARFELLNSLFYKSEKIDLTHEANLNKISLFFLDFGIWDSFVSIFPFGFVYVRLISYFV